MVSSILLLLQRKPNFNKTLDILMPPVYPYERRRYSDDSGNVHTRFRAEHEPEHDA